MDTIDRSHSNLPAQFSTQLSPLPPQTPALSFEQTGAPSINIGPKVIVRGLTRHWMLILLLWAVAVGSRRAAYPLLCGAEL